MGVIVNSILAVELAIVRAIDVFINTRAGRFLLKLAWPLVDPALALLYWSLQLRIGPFFQSLPPPNRRALQSALLKIS